MKILFTKEKRRRNSNDFIIFRIFITSSLFIILFTSARVIDLIHFHYKTTSLLTRLFIDYPLPSPIDISKYPHHYFYDTFIYRTSFFSLFFLSRACFFVCCIFFFFYYKYCLFYFILYFFLFVRKISLEIFWFVHRAFLPIQRKDK